jgi:hypothetical protein
LCIGGGRRSTAGDRRQAPQLHRERKARSSCTRRSTPGDVPCNRGHERAMPWSSIACRSSVLVAGSWMIPRLPMYRPLCEIATTSPNGVTRFCHGLRSRRILAGRASADVDCRFVLTFSEINNVPREPTQRPFGITYRDDHLPPHPINLRQFQRRPKAALPRWARRAPCGRRKAARAVAKSRSRTATGSACRRTVVTEESSQTGTPASPRSQ